MFDQAVSSFTLGKEADHSPIYPDSASGIPKFTLAALRVEEFH
jgi:hypothetical protein